MPKARKAPTRFGLFNGATPGTKYKSSQFELSKKPLYTLYRGPKISASFERKKSGTTFCYFG